MAERTYRALVGVVHAGRGVRAGQRFKAEERSRAIRTALAFRLIEPYTPPRTGKSRRMTTETTSR